jgi:nitrate/TMAO reductase-like tetraheme cytochrome c subunit
MQASKEVWGKIFGTIDTRQKFQAHRLELAKNEWVRMKANDSLECRNCHSSAAMDFTKQTRRAAWCGKSSRQRLSAMPELGHSRLKRTVRVMSGLPPLAT